MKSNFKSFLSLTLVDSKLVVLLQYDGNIEAGDTDVREQLNEKELNPENVDLDIPIRLKQ